jgi:hypothetical protein
MVADRQIAGRLCKLNSDLGFEPLPMLIEERDASDRSVADLSCYLGDTVKLDFWLRVQDIESLERSKTINFLPWRQIAVIMILYHAKTAHSEAYDLFDNVGFQPTQQNGIMPRAVLDPLITYNPG